jgi:O-antigen/teichoic acid export membrane protein
MKLKKFIFALIREGHPRSIIIKKNIVISVGLRGVSLLIGFLLVPLTLTYLNPTKYGIWLTLSSIMGWFSFFDIGLGNGLRNKLAEAFALNDSKLAKIYISTTYAILTIIIGGIYLLFLLLNSLLNWTKILNSPPEMASELSLVVLVVFTFFSIRFILNLIGIILTANQLPAYNNVFSTIGSLIAFIGIYIITKISHGSLLYISIIYSSVPVFILLGGSIFFFKKKYKEIKPSIAFVDFKYFTPLASLGMKFFILQIAALVIFATDNLIITQILGPEEVTPYNIAFKYFGIPIMGFTIITTPYWSAVTDANALNDMSWMKNALKKLIRIWLLIIVGVIIMLIASNSFYLMWIGDIVHIPFLLSALMALYAIVLTWNSIFGCFVNGIGKIKLQMYEGIIGMIINIPISIFFAKNLDMGSAGVILGTIISLTIGSFLIPIQTVKLIRGKAKGIWNK